MRTLIGVIAATMMFATAAFAAEVEGLIKTINREDMTITLDNGTSYKLPGEFDVDALQEGMDILLAYDKVGDTNLITDMALAE